MPRTGNWIGSWQNVRRHDKYERRVFLNYWFLALSPGRYRVHALYTPQTVANGKTETHLIWVKATSALER